MVPDDPAVQSTDNFQDLSLRNLISDWAGKNPDSIAIAAPGRSPLTYGGLIAQVDKTAETLNSMGIGRNDRVAIVLPNGPEMATAFLSVASCSTSAPLNPAYRAGEYEFYLSDLNAKALVIKSGMDSPSREVAQKLDIPIIELSFEPEMKAGAFTLTGHNGTSSSETGFAQPDDVALVLHTSGTTSRPKMVPLTHTNICTSANNIRSTLKLSEKDRCLNVMPLFHIHGLMAATLSSMASGASIFCTPGFYAPKFFGWMEEFHPTWYSAVPTMHQSILDRAQENRRIIDHCKMRFVRSSSASLPPQVMANLEKVFNAPVIEAYGMTEASHQMASNPLPPKERKVGSVGPAAGPEVAIMDEEGNLMSSNATGEIVIRGANVTRGYENNPEANESAFTNGWFRTGDQGYLDDDGYLFITGRLKEIINRGGEKISPREVDEVLMDHPAVAQAVTFAIPHSKLGEDVGAAVVRRENASATERGLQEFAVKRLADFKVPRRIIFVPEIPKGPTGKLQRIGLAERLGLTVPDSAAPYEEIEYVAPRNPVEEKLASIWSQVLGIKRVGVLDNFFQLGGDSVLAAQIIVQARKTIRMSGDFPLFSFIQSPTIERMASIIRERGWSPDWSPLVPFVPLQPGSSKRPFFCIHSCVCEVFNYADLANRLGPDQPFYALRAQGTYGEKLPHTRLEHMASHYIKEIKTIQPKGPYLIGGGGPGGRIALEMAHQLLAEGEKVDLLLMMDAGWFGGPIRETVSEEDKQESASPAQPEAVSEDLSVLGPSYSRKSLLHYVKRSFHHLKRGQFIKTFRGFLRLRFGKYYWRLAYNPILRPFHSIRRRIDYRNYTMEVLTRAAYRYSPKAYPGRIVYFLSESREEFFDDGWHKLAGGGLDVHVIPGVHLGMLREPYVRVLAEKMRPYLD